MPNPQNKNSTIFDLFPVEIMMKFLEEMDLSSMGKMIFTNTDLTKLYLEEFRKR